MRETARILIIKNNKILLFHRFKKGKEYYSIPGGGIEKGETKRQAAIREIKEETTLDIKLKKLLWTYSDEFAKSNYYLCDSFIGTAKLSGEELIRHNDNTKENKYYLKWVNLNEIKNIPLVPQEIKNKIIDEFS